MNKIKIIRSSTVPTSLVSFLEVSIKDLKSRYNLVLVSSPGKDLDYLRDKYGLKTIVVSMERHISPIKDLCSLWKLIKVFHKEKPYLVHSMTPKAGLLCMMAAWITRVPRRVHTFTGLVWPTAKGISRKVLMLTDWLTCACATHVIPEGQGVMNDLQKHITHKPMRVLGYGNVRGVDMEYWSKQNVPVELYKKVWKPKVFTFIFVGRIVHDKGINELVEAFSRLSKQHDVRLLLVGKFEDKLDPISDKARKKILENKAIDYVGPQYGKDLLAYYAASDCFVFPSYREGFPNTVLEAGAMGLPSIVTDINGSREIIIRKNAVTTSGIKDVKLCDNGIVVPSKNEDLLYRAMLMMLEDEDQRTSMAKNARNMVASRFEQGFVQKCLFDFYDEIM